MWSKRNSRGGLLPQVIALQLGALLLVMVPTTQILASDTGEDSVIHLAVAANTVDTVISEVIVREAYERIGYRVEITRYPPERALKLADSGQADGDVQRIDGLSKHYPNLIQLQPAINYIEGSVFTAGKDISVDGWDSLRPHRIGLIRGIKFAELNTEGMDRHFVGNYPALFTMLNKGRFDLIVSPRLNGSYQLKRLQIEGIGPVEPAVARFDLYHYIHTSRADLAPKLEAVFREMQATGELESIRERVIAELLRRAAEGLPVCDDDYACFEPSGTDGG
jgi:ABC-type amino acid transport substrate-binding protein